MTNADAARAYIAIAEQPPLDALLATDWRHAPPRVKRYPGPGLAPPERLGRLLRRACGLTRYQWDDGHTLPGQLGLDARAAGRALTPVPSAGGLGSTEVYVITDGQETLPAGAYHYGPASHRLTLVSRPHAAEWMGAWVDPQSAHPEAGTTIVITTVFERLSFKYGEFAFRLQCLDAGVQLAQFALLAEAQERPHRRLLTIPDTWINTHLGLDPAAERAIAALWLPRPAAAGATHADPPHPRGGAHQPTPATTPRPMLDTLPRVRALLDAGHPESGRENETMPPTATPSPGETIPLGRAELDLAAATAARRSADGAFRGAITTDQLGALLAAAAPEPGITLMAHANTVRGVAPGSYVYQTDTHALAARTPPSDTAPADAPSVPGRFNDDVGAAVLFYPCGDYAATLELHGDHGYQLLNLRAGGWAHRLGLAATALGLGARIQCSFHSGDAAQRLHLSTLRPLCQVLVGAPLIGATYTQPLVAPEDDPKENGTRSP